MREEREPTGGGNFTIQLFDVGFLYIWWGHEGVIVEEEVSVDNGDSCGELDLERGTRVLAVCVCVLGGGGGTDTGGVLIMLGGGGTDTGGVLIILNYGCMIVPHN